MRFFNELTHHPMKSFQKRISFYCCSFKQCYQTYILRGSINILSYEEGIPTSALLISLVTYIYEVFHFF